ncbi:MAG: protein kinase [Myxococcales bacterium]|nr:protein kinase [Myxococcales bacterium]
MARASMATCPTCRLAVDDAATECPIDGTPLAGADPIGQVLGERYRILSKLGEGGMGTVYLAEHVVLGKKLAVKVLRPELTREEEQVRRFQQEAVAASRIGQENIVDVIDFGRSPGGALYFVMEYIDGQSLTDLLREQGALPPPRALPLLAQICRALGAAHSRGIVHRDLKPDNVIVTRRDDGSELAKVLDFGISKVSAAPGGARLTRVGILMGTPEYMAPEQIDSASVDLRVDIYSFGALAYEVLTGSLPFRATTPVAILMKHQSEAVEPPSRRRPDLGLPPPLERMVLRALSKKPDERQQSMSEVLGEIASCMAALGLGVAFTPVPGTLPAVRAKGQPLLTPLPSSVAQPARAATPSRPPFASGTPSQRGGTMQLSAEELGGDAPRTQFPLPSPAIGHEQAAPGIAGADGRPVRSSQPAAPIRLSDLAAPAPNDGVAHPAGAGVSEAVQASPGFSGHAAIATPPVPPPAAGSGEREPAPARPATVTGIGEVDARALRRGPGRLVAIAAALLALLVGAYFGAGLLRPSPAPASVPEAPPPAPAVVEPAPTEPSPPPPGLLPPPAPPASKRVSLESVPPGASVWEGPRKVGVTPVEVELAQGAVADYRFKLEGYRTAARRVSSDDGRVEVKLAKARKRGAAEEEDPYGKIEDLKEDPF